MDDFEADSVVPRISISKGAEALVTASLLNLASRLIEKDSHAGQAGSNQTEGGRPERLTQSATITTGFLSHVLFSGKLVKLHESSGKSAEVGYESGCSPNGGQFDLAENLDPAPIPDNPVATTDVSYIAKELAWLSAETSLMLAASPDDNTVPLALPFAWVHGSLPMRRRIATQFPHQTHRAAMNGKMIIIDGRKLLLDDASAESISHLRAEAVAGMRLGFYRKASVQETIERSVSSRQGGSVKSPKPRQRSPRRHGQTVSTISHSQTKMQSGSRGDRRWDLSDISNSPQTKKKRKREKSSKLPAPAKKKMTKGA